jgi:hypothetical protein
MTLGTLIIEQPSKIPDNTNSRFIYIRVRIKTVENCWTCGSYVAVEESSNLLLSLASAIILGFGRCRDPRPYFCSFQEHFYVRCEVSTAVTSGMWRRVDLV